MDELLDHNRRVPKMSPIVVTEQIHRAHHMSPAQRRYTVRLRVARLDAIAKAFGTSFQVIKDAFGMHFLPKLLKNAEWYSSRVGQSLQFQLLRWGI